MFISKQKYKINETFLAPLCKGGWADYHMKCNTSKKRDNIATIVYTVSDQTNRYRRELCCPTPILHYLNENIYKNF